MRAETYIAAIFLLAVAPLGGGAVPGPAAAQGRPLPEAENLIELADRSMGCVVSVLVTGGLARVEQNPFSKDPVMRSFFGVPEVGAEGSFLASGTGVILDADRGLIVTNYHVIARAEAIEVEFVDGRRERAIVIGHDLALDLAVMLVAPDGLCAIPLAETPLAIGEPVFAVGNPYGLGHTVTQGIVSALHRENLRLTAYEDFIQTDALIYPGGSGGALINMKGELVGLNTAIMGPNGGGVGIGFAIPAVIVRNEVEQIVAHGNIFHPAVGLTVIDTATALEASLTEAALRPVAVVQAVAMGSAAELAGLKEGDVVVTVMGRPVRDARTVRNRLGLMPGSNVAIEVLRAGQPLTLEIRIPL